MSGIGQLVIPVKACMPYLVDRQSELIRLARIKTYLLTLEKEIPNLRIFDPFPIICPEGQRNCSSHRGETMLFTDSNHLSREGVRLLETPFVAFLEEKLPAVPDRSPVPRREKVTGSL